MTRSTRTLTPLAVTCALVAALLGLHGALAAPAADKAAAKAADKPAADKALTPYVEAHTHFDAKDAEGAVRAALAGLPRQNAAMVLFQMPPDTFDHPGHSDAEVRAHAAPAAAPAEFPRAPGLTGRSPSSSSARSTRTSRPTSSSSARSRSSTASASRSPARCRRWGRGCRSTSSRALDAAQARPRCAARAAPRAVAVTARLDQTGSSSISLPWFSPVNSLSSACGNWSRPRTMSSFERSLPAAIHCAISATAAANLGA